MSSKLVPSERVSIERITHYPSYLSSSSSKSVPARLAQEYHKNSVLKVNVRSTNVVGEQLLVGSKCLGSIFQDTILGSAWRII